MRAVISLERPAQDLAPLPRRRRRPAGLGPGGGVQGGEAVLGGAVGHLDQGRAGGGVLYGHGQARRCRPPVPVDERTGLDGVDDAGLVCCSGGGHCW